MSGLKQDLRYLTNPLNPFYLLGHERKFDQTNPLRVLILQYLNVILLHLFSDLVEIAVRLLDDVIDNQMIYPQFIFIKILDNPLGLSHTEGLRNRDNDKLRFYWVPNKIDYLFCQVFPATDDF